MSDFTWLVYLAEVLPRFGALAYWMVLACIILALVLFICKVDSDIKGIKTLRPAAIAFAMVPVFTSIGILIPSTKTIYLMAGAEVVTDVAQTPEVQKVRTILNSKLDEYLAETEEPEPEEEE